MNQKPDKLIPAIYGGIIMGLLSAIPFVNFINCLCCAGILLGGVLAVMFYKNNFTPDTPPFTAGDCMSVGALAGVVGAFVGTFLDSGFQLMFGNMMGEMALEWMRGFSADIPDELMAQMEEMLTQGLTIGGILAGLFFSLIIDTLFGVLGGLIGYSFFKPKQSITFPPPTSSPQAPV